MPKLESEWLKLWCPKARPVTVVQISGISVSVASGNRGPEGEVTECAKCIGSDCAAWAWETERPEDGFETHNIHVASYYMKEKEEYIKNSSDTWMVRYGYELAEYIPGKHAIWRKPWQPFGFCCAFPNPNRFPSPTE